MSDTEILSGSGSRALRRITEIREFKILFYMDIERFFIITNPLYWIAYIIGSLILAIAWLWKKVLWSRKRFYWHVYDFYDFKRVIKKHPLTKVGLSNAKIWLKRQENNKIKHRYLEQIKSILQEEENRILKEEAQKRATKGANGNSP